MVRGNMIRVVLAVASAVMAVSGCQCPDPNPPVTCAESTITFDQPTDGAMVDSPFDVSISARNADGSAFSFDSASLRAGGMSFTGTVSGNRATFTGVTAVAGALELSASIAQGSCSKTATQVVTVRSTSCTTPAVTAVTFPQDTNGDATLNSLELPNDQLQVRVTATCVSGVQVRIKRGNTVVGPLTEFMNGAALVTVPVTGNDRYELFAELVRDGAAVNQPVGAALGTIQISRSTPSCSVTTSGVFGPRDDAEPSIPGFQMRVLGTMAATGSGSLEVNGQQAVAVTPNMAGDVSADFTLNASDAYTATLTCLDAAGNRSTATGAFSLDFDPPTVTITPPPAVVTDSPLRVTVATNAEDGSQATVARDGVSVGFGVVANGMVTLEVPFGADGVYVIDVTIEDLAGNTATGSVTVTVDLSGCGLLFTRPATASALLTPAQLSSGTYAFQTSSDPLCAGQQARLYRSDRQADGGLSAETQVGTTTLVGGTGSFAPLTMTNGDFVFRGEVTNLNDAGVSAATVHVAVDLEGPAITNPIVPTGQPAALITAAQDTQPSTPGVQRTLTFSARVPMGGSVDVCITQMTDGTTTLLPSAECGSGYFRLRQGVTSPASGFTFPEGAYSMKVVVVGSGLMPAPASAPVSLVVDGSRPCVQGITRSLPQDLNGDGRLNIAELAGAQPLLQFTLGCGDTAATLASTNGVVLRDITSGALGAARASTTSFAGSIATVTLTGPYTTELDLNLFVELSDLVGNKNLLAAMNDPATYSFRVDPVAPLCAVTAPTQASLGIAQVPGGNLTVDIGTSADVGTNGVSATFTGQAARALTPALNTASTTYALTGDSTYTIGATCTDASGNATTATARTTRVDLVAPTCAIASPAAGTMSTSKDISTTVTVGDVAAGQLVTVTSSVNGISNNLLTVGGTAATGVVSYPNGLQTITATVADDVGNTCTTVPVSITVNSTSCTLAFDPTGPVVTNAQGSWLNRAGVGLPEQGTTPANGAAVIKVVTSDCGAGKSVYLYAGAASATPGGTPVQTVAGGIATFASTAFPEGALYTVTIDNGTGQLTHRSFTVSLKAPTVASIALQRSATVMTAVAVAKDAALVFGAAQGNRRVETATAADLVFGDLNGAIDDAQFQLTLAGLDGANVGAFQGRLDVLEGSTALLPTVTVGAAPFAPSLPVLKLGHRLDDSTTTLVIRVTSPAGNTFTSSHVSMVDVIAPAAPTVTRNLTSARAATVELTWGAVYDDGSNAASGGLTGGTPVAGYDVRWTTSSVPSNNSMAAGADYFGSSSKADSVEAWSASSITKALTLPPLNTYFIAVRARDEVGNYSTFAAPTGLDNMWTELTLTVANAPADFGQTILANANVTGTLTNDIVVAAPSFNSIGAVFVFNGSAALASQTTCAAGCTQLNPPDSVGTFFGSDVSSGGNVGDDTADTTTAGMSDIVVGQRGYTTTGRAFVFFGSTGTITKSIEIRGDASNQIGWTATRVGDLDGDGLSEVALPAHNFGAGRGRVYIFKGRSFASWQSAFVAGQQYIAVTSADWVIEGEYLYASTPTNTSNGLGLNRLGVTTLPGVTGRSSIDGGVAPELVVSIPRGNVSRLAIYGAAQITASSGAAPLGAFDGGIQVLSQTPFASNSISLGFGASVWGSAPVQRLDLADMYVGYPNEARVYRYSSWFSGGVTGGVATEFIQGVAGFGSNVLAGDLNDDGRLDLFVGEGSASNNVAWILFQRSAGFDSPVGGSNVQFNVSLLRSVRNGGVTSQMPNRFIGFGDFGVGTSVLAADAASGSIRIWK